MKEDYAALDVTEELKMMVTLTSSDLDKTGKLLNDRPFPYYVLLLGRESDTKLAAYVADNWKALHRMSGKNCLMLSVFPPKEFPPELAKEWEERLGDSFKEFTGNSADPSASYEIAAKMRIPYEKLPCLFLCDSLEAGSGKILTIPDWTSPDLTLVFEAIFQTLNTISPEKPNRMELLSKALRDYPLDTIRIAISQHWTEYVNVENLKTAIEVVFTAILIAMKKALGVPVKS